MRRGDGNEMVLHERGVAAEESPSTELSVESGGSNVKRIRTWLVGLLRRQRPPAIEPPQPRAALPNAERVPVATPADAHTVSSVPPLPLRAATRDDDESLHSSPASTDIPRNCANVHTGIEDERYSMREGAYSHGGSPVTSQEERTVSGIESAPPESVNVTGQRDGRSRIVQPRRVFRGPSATRKIRANRVAG